MQDDWKPGDLALCVRDKDEGPLPPVPFEIKVGGVYEIHGVGWSNEAERLTGTGVVLSLAADPNRSDWGWSALCFKKIDPLTEEEEREFKADLDADRVRREPVYQGNYLGMGIYKVPSLDDIDWRA